MKTLVIGYGDPQQGDAGVAYRAAEAVVQWGLQAVQAHSYTQLTPALAAALATPLAEADQIIFVEAAPAQNPCSPLLLQSLALRSVTAPPTGNASTANTSAGNASTGDPSLAPAHLLALATPLRSTPIQAYSLRLPTRDCNPGENLSAIAELGLRQGLQYIRSLLN